MHRPREIARDRQPEPHSGILPRRALFHLEERIEDVLELMGRDASARFRFIMERAEEAEELDV